MSAQKSIGLRENVSLIGAWVPYSQPRKGWYAREGSPMGSPHLTLPCRASQQYGSQRAVVINAQKLFFPEATGSEEVCRQLEHGYHNLSLASGGVPPA